MALLTDLRSSPRLLAVLVVTAWLLVAAAYCYFHGYVELNGTPDIAFSLGWALQSWGAWLLLAPLLVGVGHDANLSTKGSIGWAVIALLAAVAVAMGLNAVAETPLSVSQKLYWTVPQSAALLAIVLVTELLRRHWAYRAERAARTWGKIKIDTGDAVALVANDEIRWVGADGNYVEISDGRHRGRLRCTLSQFASELPEERFHRVHRSFLVNVDFIDRIETVPGTRSTRVHLLGDSRAIPASRQGLESLRKRLAH